MNTYELSPDLRAQIDATLQGAERMVCLTRPRCSWLAPGLRFFIVFAACWLTLVSCLTWGLLVQADSTVSPAEYLFVVPFWLVGLGFLGGVCWHKARVERTAYLVTTQRAVILRPSLLFRPQELSWPLSPGMVLDVVMRANGYGDIVLGRKAYEVNHRPAPEGFLDIPNMQEVLAVLQAQIAESCGAAPTAATMPPVPASPAEPQANHKKNGCGVWIMSAVFTWVGLLFVGVGCYIYLEDSRIHEEGLRAEACVVRLVKDEDHDSVTYFPVVKFTDARGVTHTKQSSWSSNTLRRGDCVEVIYLPHDPQSFLIATEANHVLPYGFMGMGGLAALIGLCTFVRAIATRKKK